jgi:hypothetical protein
MFLFGLLLLAIRVDLLPSVGWVLWFMLTLAACYVGLMKLDEPPVQLSVDEYGVRYHHKKGCWQLNWQDIELVQQIEINGVGVSWIGFRLRDYDGLLAELPLRLAVHLLMEQRALLVAAMGANCPTGRCASEFLTVDTEYRYKQRLLKGVQAMFTQRMVVFRQLLNADLVVPAQLLDTTPTDFCLEMNRFRLSFAKQNNG